MSTKIIDVTQNPATRNYNGRVGDTLGPDPITFKETGTDFTGSSVTIVIKNKESSDEILISKNPTLDTATLGEATFNFELTPSDTEDLDENETYWYGMQFITATSRKYTIVVGEIQMASKSV